MDNNFKNKYLKYKIKYLELKDQSFEGFINWIIDLRKKLNLPHKLSEVIKREDFDIEKLSIMALDDPSTSTNPKKMSIDHMKILYEHSFSGKLF